MRASAPTGTGKFPNDPCRGCFHNYNTVIPHLQVSPRYAIIILLLDRKEELYGSPKSTRKLRLTPWLHSGQRGLCYRHRQRLALPHSHRPVRRRHLCAVLPALFGAHGSAGPDDGAGRGPCGPRRGAQRLQGTGARGQQVAYPRLVLHGGLCAADDVLHHRLRLDGRLLLPLPDRQL